MQTRTLKNSSRNAGRNRSTTQLRAPLPKKSQPSPETGIVLTIPEYVPNIGTLMVHYGSEADYEEAVNLGEVGSHGECIAV